MADGPNFGLLQPTTSPNVQVINRPDISQQNAQGLLSGIQQGSELAARNQQMALAQKELEMKQQLQPGVLAQQGANLAQTQAGTEGQLLQNKAEAVKAAQAQFAQQKHMEDLNAYSAAQKNGASPEAALDAMQSSMMSHDPTLALTMADSRQSLKAKIQEGNTKAVTDSGNLIHAIMKAAPEQGMQPLDLYTKQYKQIQKQDPDAPTPESFKGDNTAFVNAYAMPTMATALPVAKQAALDIERAKDDKLYAAQSLVKQTSQDLQSAINAHGANSSEAKAAASAAQQAQQAVRALPGQGIMGAIQNKVMGAAPGGIMGTIGNMFTGNGQPGTAGQGAPVVAPTAAPIAPPAASALPQGRITVKSPDGTIGHIPAAQLQDALKAGYSQVQG